MEESQTTNESELLDQTTEDNQLMEKPNEAYKVESWEEGEEDPTGYKIKGKSLFGKFVEMLRTRSKKPKFIKKIKDHRYCVTDVRTIKHGSELDIKIEHEEKVVHV